MLVLLPIAGILWSVFSLLLLLLLLLFWSQLALVGMMKNVIQAEVVNCFTEQEHLRSQFVKIIHGKTMGCVWDEHTLIACINCCLYHSDQSIG